MLFISLDYSPWSEKARWALDWSGVSYTNKAYLSMLDEPWLRLKTKRFKGPVSVPALVDGKSILTDSFDIAKYADQQRVPESKQSLFPSEEKVRAWNSLSEKALGIGRYHCVEKQLKNRDAQLEALPSFIPEFVKPYSAWLAKSGLYYHLKKYPLEGSSEDLKDVFDKLRAALKGKRYILDDFSYCDIAMALSLQFIKPVDSVYSAPGPAAAECWTNHELCEDYADLIEWRDWLYTAHRFQGTSAV